MWPARTGPPQREVDSAAVSAQVAVHYGITGAVCNGRRPLRYSRTGQQFTCTAGPTTYCLTVTDLDPLEFSLASTD